MVVSGAGIVKLTGAWNRRLLGSTVMTGLALTNGPSGPSTSWIVSFSIGNICQQHCRSSKKTLTFKKTEHWAENKQGSSQTKLAVVVTGCALVIVSVPLWWSPVSMLWQVRNCRFITTIIIITLPAIPWQHRQSAEWRALGVVYSSIPACGQLWSIQMTLITTKSRFWLTGQIGLGLDTQKMLEPAYYRPNGFKITGQNHRDTDGISLQSTDVNV